MKINKKIFTITFLIIGAIGILAFTKNKYAENENILSHVVDLKIQNLKFYWKNNHGEVFGNFEKLRKWSNSKNENLIFATNGGMYKKDQSPQGLFIENGKLKSKIDRLEKGYGNFYLQPNGIFCITNDNIGIICKTPDFKNKNIKYATQSGPLLVIDGEIHDKFRNGVGILPDGKLIFAMSKEKINFYDFASYFKKIGCKNALYLDGFVSKTYLPEKNWNSINGNFGVIIGETVKNN